jgi:hypothetical protein
MNAALVGNEYSGRLIVSPLPSHAEIVEMAAAGFSRFVSVCGVQLRDIYADELPAGLVESRYTFQDVFSDGIVLGARIESEHADSDIYVELTTADDRQEFLQSVTAVTEGLRHAIPTCVFCHRGIGRSPVVAAASLLQYESSSFARAIRSIRLLHPRARFTTTSLSALKWITEQYRA